MLETVLFATLRFHDTTNRGRLLNRFGKDVEGLDSSMADNCQNVLQVMSRAELPALAVVRSLAYGLDVVVTFISISYVGGLPFLVAGRYAGRYHCRSLTMTSVRYWWCTIKQVPFTVRLRVTCVGWIL